MNGLWYIFISTYVYGCRLLFYSSLLDICYLFVLSGTTFFCLDGWDAMRWVCVLQP